MSRDVALAAQWESRKRGLSIPHDSDDVAQDVLLEFLDPPEGDVPPDSYASFRHAANRKARKFAGQCFSARWPKRLSRAPLEPEAAEARQHATANYREYMDALPDENLRQVFRACVVEDLNQTEAARRLGLTRNKVCGALERIRRALKKRFPEFRAVGVPS